MGGKSSKLALMPASHKVCRSSNEETSVPYDTKVSRVFVPDDKVAWSVDYPEYAPVEYTSEKVLSNPSWADPVNPWQIFNWNKLTQVDRRSYMGIYDVQHGHPINPVGRTGIKGRGRLGKWGPNHAADPVVTRWKTDENGKKVKDPQTKKFILQFVAIQRSDTGEWAIPGGMCDAGETVSKTLKREFLEEATASTDPAIEKKNAQVAKAFDNFFKKGVQIYKGYVDDPRNTDNAWLETVVQSFHDGGNKVFKNFELKAGDDASNVQWMDIDSSIELYATHKEFIQKVANKYKAHWQFVPKPVKEKKEKTPKVKKEKAPKVKKEKASKVKKEEEKKEKKEEGEEAQVIDPVEVVVDTNVVEIIIEETKTEV